MAGRDEGEGEGAENRKSKGEGGRELKAKGCGGGKGYETERWKR